jgi:hypothetical protein
MTEVGEAERLKAEGNNNRCANATKAEKTVMNIFLPQTQAD